VIGGENKQGIIFWLVFVRNWTKSDIFDKQKLRRQYLKK
jgi:hypothetical protein